MSPPDSIGPLQMFVAATAARRDTDGDVFALCPRLG